MVEMIEISNLNIWSARIKKLGIKYFFGKLGWWDPLLVNLVMNKDLFNIRISSARRTIKNAFGILAARWRIFYVPFRANVKNVKNTLSCLSLHNNLRLTNSTTYHLFVLLTHLTAQVAWRRRNGESWFLKKRVLLPLHCVRGSWYRQDATSTRNPL